MRRHAQALGARTTTDATSAFFIATFLLTHPEKVYYEQQDTLAPLRAQWSFIEQLTKQRTALLCQLESVLYRAHPELVPVLCGDTPAWLLKLLVRYPTAERLARARKKTLLEIPYVTPERAERLQEGARRSVASARGAASEHLVREMARQVLQLSKLIKKQKKVLSEELDVPEEVEILKSFGHVGTYSAVGLLLQIGSIERFASAKEMASFFGVHPVFKQSGDGTSGVRMSKQGSRRMRSLLFMIVLGAVQDHPTIAPLYRRLTQERGMAKMAALGVCMHKTLRLFYGMLKHRQDFDAQIERRHRRRSRRGGDRGSGSQTKRRYQRRRYQRHDASAPISSRAKKRRRQQRCSQGARGTERGMSPPSVAVEEQRVRRGKDSVQGSSGSA